ncbi:MAG: EAL domain-containing protein [Oceanospirillales bacterium]|nr:MAG: EAL domain-containing protein [Oceanospirillales bacterium]
MSTLNDSSGHSYCLALQPICDLNLRHVADELLYRSSINAVSAIIHDPIQATARVCNVAFYETGIQALCGDRKLFFNAPRDWLLNPDLLPPDTDQVVIEVLEDVEGDQEVIDALQLIKSLGYKLALDDFVLTEKTLPLLDLADIIKLDILHSLPTPEDLQIYKEKGLTLLAERVEDHDIFEKCKALGFTLFQGYFYAKPVIDHSTAIKRGGNDGAQLQLLSELQKKELDYDALENLLAQDPQLCIRLLKMINSPRYRR